MGYEHCAKTIAIVGGGATGVSLLAQLLEAIASCEQSTPVRLTLFEKAREIGRGLAYSSTSESSILNMSAATMSPFPEDPKAFIRWLVQHGYISKYQAERETQCAMLYPPRSMFGEFLSEVAESLLNTAARMRIDCQRIRDEVIDVLPFGDRYIVRSEEFGNYIADYVVLCTGHLLSTTFPHLNNAKLFFSSPYPEEALKQIPSTATVGILGTRLSAVDAVVALEAHGHQGRYMMFSRTARLPAVRSLTGPVARSFEYFDPLLRSRKTLTVKDLLWAFQRELRAWCGSGITLGDLIGANRKPCDNLARDIDMALTNNTAWQDVFMGLDPYVEELWAKMDPENQSHFEHMIRSTWACLRHPMPLRNALKIQTLIQTGKLELHGGHCSPETTQTGFSIASNEREPFLVDAIVDATGPGFDATKCGSRLYRNMLHRGQLHASRFGGFSVISHSGHAIDSDGVVQNNLFVVGPQTRGTHFYTNAMDRNVTHASQVVKAISLAERWINERGDLREVA